MKFIRRFFKQLFCPHVFIFDRNIYGDEIIYSGWKRSIWQCKFCEKRRAYDDLWDESKGNTRV